MYNDGCTAVSSGFSSVFATTSTEACIDNTSNSENMQRSFSFIDGLKAAT